jgi:hypothetical protein
MAHSILVPLQSFAAALILIAASMPARGQAVQCSSDSLAAAPLSRQKEVEHSQQRLESSPFYRALAQHEGKPQSCHLELVDTKMKISYMFGDKAVLEAQVDPSIEYSKQRLEFRGLSEREAVTLLKEEEVDSYGGSGCGIKWKHPTRQPSKTRPGQVEVLYRGDVCNCQARVVYDGRSVVALVLSSTC